jgi:excisionase family DNA binding protein
LPSALPTRPIDATLSVTKAARLLGVHPNTIRAWSDAGRLRYYRINPRGDRRYRLGDLQRFLAAAENNPEIAPGSQAGQGTTHGRRGFDRDGSAIPTDRERLRRRADLSTLAALTRITGELNPLEDALRDAALVVRQRGAFRSVAIYEHRGERLIPRATAAPPNLRFVEMPRSFGALGAALDRAADGDPGPVEGDGFGSVGRGGGGRSEFAVAIPGAAIPGAAAPWGVLAMAVDRPGDDSDR